MAAWSCPECGSTVTARPRYATRTHSRARSWVRRLYRVAERMGTPLQPWQRGPARLICERRADGRPRWPTVIVSVPRQSGKTTIAKTTIAGVAEGTPDLRVYGTAQTRVDAVAHLEELALTLGPAVKARLGVGAERITWPNGSMFRVISPTDTGGHGPSVDFMLIDEAWTLQRLFLGGLRPAMAARPNAQMLITSTMGTVESDVWNGLVEMGRESLEDPGSGVAYVEYSAGSDEEVFMEDRWHHFMPALGRTVSHEHVRADMDLFLHPADFIRGYGNRTTAVLASIFPAEWVQAAWRATPPGDRITVAVDVNDSPPGGTVTAAHIAGDGRPVVRTLDWRYGTARWIPALVESVIARRTVDAVVGDFGGPAREVQAELAAICEARYVPLVDRRPRDLAADTGRLFDALREGAIYLEPNAPLEEAFAGARRKEIGDLWLVSRRLMRPDASPLIAAVLAYGTATEIALAPRIVPAIY